MRIVPGPWAWVTHADNEAMRYCPCDVPFPPAPVLPLSPAWWRCPDCGVLYLRGWLAKRLSPTVLQWLTRRRPPCLPAPADGWRPRHVPTVRDRVVLVLTGLVLRAATRTTRARVLCGMLRAQGRVVSPALLAEAGWPVEDRVP